jgi:hypothetical protein
MFYRLLAHGRVLGFSAKKKTNFPYTHFRLSFANRTRRYALVRERERGTRDYIIVIILVVVIRTAGRVKIVLEDNVRPWSAAVLEMIPHHRVIRVLLTGQNSIQHYDNIMSRREFSFGSLVSQTTVTFDEAYPATNVLSLTSNRARGTRKPIRKRTCTVDSRVWGSAVRWTRNRLERI